MSRPVCTALKNLISLGRVPSSMVEKPPIMPFVMWKMTSPQHRGSPFQIDAISLHERNALRRVRQRDGTSLRCSLINKRHIKQARQQAINIIACNNLALRIALETLVHIQICSRFNLNKNSKAEPTFLFISHLVSDASQARVIRTMHDYRMVRPFKH